MRVIAGGGVGAGVWPLGVAVGLQLCAQLPGSCQRHNGEAHLSSQSVETVHINERSWSVCGINSLPRRHRPPTVNRLVLDIGN